MFEATSGWTTTGLSVVDVTQAPMIYLFYRSLIQYAGGAGLAIITLSALVGPSGAGVSSAEGRGEQLAPHVRRSAKLVLAIYVGSLAAAMPLLRAAGMDWFDAISTTRWPRCRPAASRPGPNPSVIGTVRGSRRLSSC